MKEDIILRSKQDVEDLLLGFGFLGTGGGGPAEAGRISLYDCLDKGLELKITSLDNVDPEGYYCCPFFMGSIAPKTEETLAEIDRIGYTERRYQLEEILMGAVRTLETYTGHKMTGIYIVEPGGSNGGCCMAAAYKLGLQLVDGDPVGRAVPEATNTAWPFNKDTSVPAAYFDSWGNSTISIDILNQHALERIGKYLSQASFGEMGMCAYVMQGKDLKANLVNNTLSRSYAIGKAMREGEDLVQAAAAASQGIAVGCGEITKFSPLDSGGYYWGTYEITGTGDSAGNTYKIWFKNENHVLWKNGEVVTTSPNLISVIDLEAGVPLNNSNLREGLKVGIVISKAYPEFQTEYAIRNFNPVSLGCKDAVYTPFPQAL
ncbi:MAG: DUF917 domain-containing protein [Firmicutes bacterium]|nr:DUF917 domain-containing protein [Bacillota bacterium]